MSAMTWIPCPSCGQDLPPHQPACPHCGLSLVGPDAARLWQVDQQLAHLQLERTTLLDRLRRLPAMPTTSPAAIPAAIPAATPAASPAAVPAATGLAPHPTAAPS